MAFVTQGACLAAAHAQLPPTTSAVEEVVVLGRGETRQVQTITRATDRAAARRHEPAESDRELARRQFPIGRPVRRLRMVDAHHGSRLQSEPPGLHARRRAARRHDLRQPQRLAHQPRDSDRARRPRRRCRKAPARSTTASTSNLGGAVEFFSAEPAQRVRRRRRADVRQRFARGAHSSASTPASSARARGSPRVADGSTEKWKGAGDQDVRSTT